MDKLRTAVTQIAATVDERLPELPPFHKSFLPFVSLASWIYRLFLNIRRGLYFSAFLPCRRFPVPVISVGNLTWGGNGKTPMVEYIARYLHELGIPPLILSRGYAGGDEARMLQRHLFQTSAKIGVGANRIATADEMFERYGFMGSGSILHSENLLSPFKFGSHSRTEEIGTVILDDGMQHLSLFRDVEVVMINGLSPWGNNHLIPRGPLREPLDALCRAHIGVIHHADLDLLKLGASCSVFYLQRHYVIWVGHVSNAALKDIMLTVQKITSSVPIYFSMLSPLFLFEVKRPYAKLPLTTVINMAILCVSAIGFPDAFIRRIEEIGPSHVDRLDFSDHHSFKPNDITKIRESLRRLENRFGVKAFVLVTEKDYDRDPAILRGVDDLQIMVLCSSLQIMPLENRTEEDFRLNLKKLLFCRLNLN